MKRIRFVTSLAVEQLEDFKRLMKEDRQVDVSAYLAFLINQEIKRREDGYGKRPIGRPRKENTPELFYPSPDGSALLYTKEELEDYYAFRNMQMPPLPPPIQM